MRECKEKQKTQKDGGDSEEIGKLEGMEELTQDNRGEEIKNVVRDVVTISSKTLNIQEGQAPPLISFYNMHFAENVG